MKEGSNTMCTATFCHNDFLQRLNSVQTIIPGLKWQLTGPEHRVPEQESVQGLCDLLVFLVALISLRENPTAVEFFQVFCRIGESRVQWPQIPING